MAIMKMAMELQPPKHSYTKPLFSEALTDDSFGSLSQFLKPHLVPALLCSGHIGPFEIVALNRLFDIYKGIHTNIKLLLEEHPRARNRSMYLLFTQEPSNDRITNIHLYSLYVAYLTERELLYLRTQDLKKHKYLCMPFLCDTITHGTIEDPDTIWYVKYSIDEKKYRHL